jgi:hypothetical protein
MLQIECDKCKKELNIPGAILFSPPKDESDWEVYKFHFCSKCYTSLLDWIYTEDGVKISKM